MKPTPEQRRALEALSVFGPWEVWKQLQVCRGSTIDSLIEKGWVSRERPFNQNHPDDEIAITPAGGEALKQ
ncbi:helix-turn-helix domain-containing protein [Planctomicrobium piriforme]|uniref:Uncharacterized protein n=1 Tax=Planctomicrobium piriforme TaxID=1576369 RepID=A0A1I3EFZ6_9PLAN|nr:hypothetical protein [Planctomicrobium piriforme]SFH97887.1 hypothetical protein SAMN05421753_104206 [Planctomicrobium piriforme]